MVLDRCRSASCDPRALLVVLLASGGPLRAQTASPCPEDSAASRRMVIGFVRDAQSGTPLAGATVELHGADTTAAARPLLLRATTGANGAYLFCGVPAGAPLTISARIGEFARPPSALLVGTDGVTRKDLVIVTARRGRVVGRVTESGTARPIAGAEVGFAGSDRWTTTDGAGRFRFDDVPTGEQLLRVSHLGFGTHERVVALAPGAVTELTLDLAPSAIRLEPLAVSVRALRPRLEAAGFYERERLGFGYFIAPELLETMPDLYSALRRIPGVRLRPVSPTRYRVEFRRHGAFGSGCQPTFYLDGVKTSLRLEDLSLSSIQALEVYRGPSELPAEFAADARCGAVVAWTW